MRHIDLITSIWGEHHVGLFLNLTLPALLSPGNLPALKGRGRLLIMTMPEDSEAIASHPLIVRAKQFVDVIVGAHQINVADKFDQRYSIQAHMNKAGIAESIKAGNMAAVIAGDMILADGYCAALARWADEGKRLVLGICLRAGLESAAQELQGKIVDGVLTLTPRQVVKLGIDHMHPINQASIWSASYFNRMPYTILFPVFGQGVAVRCFGLTALLIDVHEAVLSHKGNVDHDMPKFFAAEDTYYVTDSDECMFCEVSSIGAFWPIFTRFPASADVVARWASHNACPSMWDNLEHELRFHTDDIDEARWSGPELEARRAVRDINYAAGR